MDVRQLKYLIAIIEHKSFTKAASVLRVAQPALGIQIRKLEEELAVPLLMRHSRGVIATEAGTILAERARAIIGEVDATRTAMRDLSNGRGRVLVGMSPSIAGMLAHPLIVTATQELPNVSLVIIEDMSPVLAEGLTAGRLDICIGYDIMQSAKLRGDPLLVEDIFLVLSPSFLPRPGPTTPFRALANRKLLLPVTPQALRSLVEHKAAELGIELNIGFEMQSVHLTKELVEQGVGATILPYGAVRRECEQGRLVATKIVEPAIRRTAYLACSALRPQSNAEKSVVRLIRDLVKNQKYPHTEFWQAASPLVATQQ